MYEKESIQQFEFVQVRDRTETAGEAGFGEQGEDLAVEHRQIGSEGQGTGEHAVHHVLVGQFQGIHQVGVVQVYAGVGVTQAQADDCAPAAL